MRSVFSSFKGSFLHYTELYLSTTETITPTITIEKKKLNQTYQHGRFHYIHRIGTRIASHSNCRNKFCPLWIQTVCQPKTHDTYCTRSRLRANAFPCRTNPKKNENENWQTNVKYAKVKALPSNQFQWSCYIPRKYSQKRFRNIWYSTDDRLGVRIVDRSNFHHTASSRSDSNANPFP